MAARLLLFERVIGKHARASEREAKHKEAQLAADYERSVAVLKNRSE